MKQYLFTFSSILFGYSQSTIEDPMPKVISLLVAILAELLSQWWTVYNRKKEKKNEL